MDNASLAVVRAVGETRGVDPTVLTSCLQAVVDTDALDRLLEREGVEVTLVFADHVVTARSSGDVRARPLDATGMRS